jgi:hypothetical protein
MNSGIRCAYQRQCRALIRSRPLIANHTRPLAVNLRATFHSTSATKYALLWVWPVPVITPKAHDLPRHALVRGTAPAPRRRRAGQRFSPARAGNGYHSKADRRLLPVQRHGTGTKAVSKSLIEWAFDANPRTLRAKSESKFKTRFYK